MPFSEDQVNVEKGNDSESYEILSPVRLGDLSGVAAVRVREAKSAMSLRT